MDSPDLALADLIVDDLNGHFAGQFKAERTWVPDFEVKSELDTFRLAVQPGPDPTGEVFERSGLQETWPLDFCFAKRLDNNTRQDIDNLMAVVDRVRQRVHLSDWSNSVAAWHGIGFQFLVRFDPAECQRKRMTDNTIVYAGRFMSLFRVPFLMHSL